MIDSLTKRWIKSEADEIAAGNGCYFDEKAALRPVTFFSRFLCHSKGEWAGQPFELLDWQRDDLIMPLFGWMRPDGTRRFRKTYIELPKKNGKSTLASAVGLYMTVGDGEPGAEVYSAATDQVQAGIVHGEAINMVEASPELSAVLTINRTTKNIAFMASKSWYRALSSEAAGKEGLNAHCIIGDELHVWQGRKLWDALKYAFRSRRQGLHFNITTAGDDITSVCYEQHLYALDVLNGRVHDDRFFGYVRAADKDDDWTIESTWRKANPSFGITIKPEDFAADCQEAEKTPTAQSAFKRYSLNVWATATNPWLKYEDWLACGGSFDERELAGKLCFGGLDLAKTRDMTAWALCFPWGEDRYRFLVRFFLPEETIQDRDAPEEYRVWAEQGWLHSTPGAVCDYSYVRQVIAKDKERFKIKDYAFDPYQAEETTQIIENEIGLKRFEFRQTITNYAEPTAEFERLVIAGQLEHSNHPVLNWQAGHVTIKADANNNKRPVKPEHGDHRKIDGIVASIMALARAIHPDNKRRRSIYATERLSAL